MGKALNCGAFGLDLNFELLVYSEKLVVVGFEKLAVSGDVFVESEDLLALFFSEHVFSHEFFLVGFFKGKCQFIIGPSEHFDFFLVFFDVAETLSDMAFNLDHILITRKDGLELFLDFSVLHFALLNLNLKV
jgi:hypothetical protein